MASSSNGKSFFDLHVTGLGYVNRIRTVKPRKGDPFLACDINALCGPSDDVEYCRFDVKVSGTDAQHLIRRCEEAVKAERKVLIGFRLGDLWLDQFTYSDGKPGAAMKARLLFVSWIKVDKTVVYKAKVKESDEPARDEPPVSEPSTEPSKATATTAPAEAVSSATASNLSVASAPSSEVAAEAASVSNAVSGGSF